MASTPEGGARSLGRRIAAAPPRLWLALVLLVLGASFIAQNRATVRVRWLAFSVNWPLWLALLVVMVIGVLIGLLARRRSAKRR
ncbi:LapA family protein [Streptosporangium sp. NPDC051023]|uniref:LapA family protein n=1 Tax=Streptosporangium sp. NPDC051023 TaxID=3155410 RepID=UPI0034500ECE